MSFILNCLLLCIAIATLREALVNAKKRWREDGEYEDAQHIRANNSKDDKAAGSHTDLINGVELTHGKRPYDPELKEGDLFSDLFSREGRE